MKSLSSRKTVLLGIAVIALILLGWGYTSGFFFERGLTPCAPPPGMMVDGVARASVYTWLDENGNGVSDPGESPLPGVEIIYPALSKPTDKQGQAETSQFKPGCACRCWENEYVEVRAPEGYQATTPLRLELTGETGQYSFGFKSVEPAVSILPEQTATQVPHTPTPSPTTELMTESGYPAPPASPTPLSPAEPWMDCARTPSLIGCDPSAPVMAGHVAFYDLEGGQLVGIDLKTGEGWAVAMPVPESLEWSPDGSQLLVRVLTNGEARTADSLLLANDGRILNVFTGKKWMYWQPQGASPRNYDEPKVFRSESGGEAWLENKDNQKILHYRPSEKAEWEIIPLDMPVDLFAELQGWIPGTPNLIISQMVSASSVNNVMFGRNHLLFNTQTEKLTDLQRFNGKIDPQQSVIHGSKVAILQLRWGLGIDTLAILDGTTGTIDFPLPQPQLEFDTPDVSLWQLGWQPLANGNEGLFVLMVNKVDSKLPNDILASSLFPQTGVYLYDHTTNEAQMIRAIAEKRVGGNFHFTGDGRYLLYNEGPRDVPGDKGTRMYIYEMDTGKEWVLLERLVSPGDFMDYIDWNLIAVSME